MARALRVILALIAWTVGSFLIAVLSGGDWTGGPSWPPSWIGGCVLIVAVAYLRDRGSALPDFMALAIWSGFVLYRGVFGGSHIATILQLSSGPFAGRGIEGFDNTAGYWPQLTIWILGVVLILAVGYLIEQRRVPLDVVALIVWTVAFAVITIPGPGETVCPSAGLPAGGLLAHTAGGAGQPFGEPYCYVAWTPGIARFAVWIAVSLLILGVGYLARRRDQRNTPVASMRPLSDRT